MVLGASENPSAYGVNLPDREQQNRWAEISRRLVLPTRIPSNNVLTQLGLADDFWQLCTLGQGVPEGDATGYRSLYHLMSDIEVYRGPTLEFLSTLQVHKKGRPHKVTKITFRLNNTNRTLRPEDLRQVFHLPPSTLEEESSQLNDNLFWSQITHQTNFTSGDSKSSSIRNPVLRILHRAISSTVFPRSDSGSVSNNELFIMYCLLNKKVARLGNLLPVYWERIASRSSTSDILCGNQVTLIMRHFRIHERKTEAVPGDGSLGFESLANMDIVKVDTNKRPYVYQGKGGDHFPLPCPRLTRVDTFDGNTSNWKMDTPLHRRVIAAHPYTGHWLKNTHPITTPIPVLADGASSSQAEEHPMEEDHENEDEHPEREGIYYYNRRTRDRAQREEEDVATMAARLGRLETLGDERWETQMQWNNQSNERWETQMQWNQQNDHRWMQADQRWTQQQGWHEQNTASWTQQQEWNTQQHDVWQHHEATYWNRQLDEQRQQSETIRNIEARQQQMMAMFEQMNTNFTDFTSRYPPPPPQP